MRWSRWAPLVLAGLSVLGATNDAQARYEGNLNLFVGQLWLTKGDWAPVDQQPEIGLMLAFGEERAPIHFAIDVFASSASTDNPGAEGLVKGASREVAIGVRKVWDDTVTKPHLGAGATTIQATQTFDGVFNVGVAEDRAYGAWVDLGVTWRLVSHLNLGLEARYSYAPATLGSGSSGRDVNAGGIHFGVLIGYGW